ncbi:hypothetical protein AB0K08_12440 [Citricoccus sp. NPDC055426]|uniref:hypothetical protein n=1 Tax=Citricoccus sp. NPDC055426 TaxID=3155536 RepID=UPI003426F883
MTVTIAGLPEKLPNTGDIDAAAGDIKTAGTNAASYAEDGVTSWSGLSAHYSTPDAETALNAVNMVQVYADEASTCATSVKTALGNFADAIEALRSEYNLVKQLAGTHNAVDTTVADFDYAAHATERNNLQKRINDVATDYDDASKTCADAIRAANTGKLFELTDGGLPVAVATFVTKTALEGYTTKGSTKYFTYNFSAPRIVRPAVLDKLPIPPKFVDRIDTWAEAGNNAINQKHRQLLPDFSKRQFAERTGGFDPVKNPHFTALMASPAFRRLLGTDGKAKNPSLRRLVDRHHLSVKNGTVTVGYAATDGKTKGTPKAPKWAKNTLRGMNAAGHVAGFASATSAQYEELRQKHPDWSEAQLKSEAVADGVTTQVATAVGEEVGAKVGTQVGRYAGAAIGQALIPIPGVGAAIGGIAGGFVGNFVGGWVGGKVGGAIGDWVADNTDFTETAKDVGESIGKAAGKAKDFIGGLFG